MEYVLAIIANVTDCMMFSHKSHINVIMLL